MTATARAGARAVAPLALPDPPVLSPAAWRALDDEVVALLQEFLRVPTVNPPGNELALARMIAALLAQAGIEHELVQTAPERAVITGRLRGRGAGEQAGVLLLAHMDVVDVEPREWTVDPFGGELRDGYLYGRGAIDDKGMLAANLATVLGLQRHLTATGATLERDVVFVATPDEEAGSEAGLVWLLEHRPELLAAACALNEGGRVRVVDGRPLYAAVQTAEKVPHLLALRAQGPSGHASVPLRENALVRLARAVAVVGAHAEPLRLGETTREFFARLAAIWPEPHLADAMAAVVSGDAARMAEGERVLAAHPAYDAVLRTGISAVRLEGGIRENVIPAEGTAFLNVRTLPGESIDGTVARLRAAIDDPHVELSVVSRGADAPASPVDAPMFAALTESLRDLVPGLAVAPYLSTGATDNARLRRAGIPAYGLLPFPLPPEDEARMHGHDERVRVDALRFGVRVLVGAVARVAGCDA
ncbi:MAG TPA: M20/M25/M40 family metallo-hydrolase [Gemmatimonadaceae bacterium]|nr:M20/M25/M40 family metallo-hydrolase [Gemmatimonadaceae bacterium]